MEELWYKKEEQQTLMEEEAMKQAARRAELERDAPSLTLDEIRKDTSASGPWLFISHTRNLNIVKQPSWKETDPITKSTSFHPGSYIEFHQGRFQTRDPEEVDFLISKKEFGGHFTAAFNVDAYKSTRRGMFGLPMRDKKLEPILPISHKLPARIQPIAQPMEESSGIAFKEIADEDLGSFFKGDKVITPNEEEVQHFASKQNTDPRVDILEEKVEKISTVLNALADKLLAEKEIPEQPKKPESTYEGYKCKRCGMAGFSSGHEVAKHRKNGECNRILADKIVAEGSSRIITGPATAGGGR